MVLIFSTDLKVGLKRSSSKSQTISLRSLIHSNPYYQILKHIFLINYHSFKRWWCDAFYFYSSYLRRIHFILVLDFSISTPLKNIHPWTLMISDRLHVKLLVARNWGEHNTSKLMLLTIKSSVVVTLLKQILLNGRLCQNPYFEINFSKIQRLVLYWILILV